MADPKKVPRELGKKAKKLRPRGGHVAGQAATAKRNREREVRRRIIEALRRARIPYNQWPDFVRAFCTDPHQHRQYQQCAIPSPFHAPEFDRLSQSPQDWVKESDKAWKRHQNQFLQQRDYWVRVGLDEEIVQGKRTRGPGTKMVGHQRRGDNTPIDQRYEWAAKRLVKIPLKEIAGADADASTVGRIAREIIRSAAWPTRSRANRTEHRRSAPTSVTSEVDPLQHP